MAKEIEANPIMETNNDPYINLQAGLFVKSKRKHYMQLMKKLKFSRNFSMYDVIKERMPKRIYHPGVESAYLLYKAMT